MSGSLDYSSLLELAAEIVSECQVGDISSSFNISGGCNSVTVPSSDPDAEAIVYNTPSPDHLVFTVEPVPEYEGVPLHSQPIIQAVDISVSCWLHILQLTLVYQSPCDRFLKAVYSFTAFSVEISVSKQSRP